MKKYHAIGEVSALLGLTVSLLRFWEKEFSDILPPVKMSVSGQRQFTSEDIENFKRICKLVKDEKYTLAGAKKRLKHLRSAKGQAHTKKKEQLIRGLEELKEFLLTLRRKD